MGINCRIQYNKDGEINFVETPEGKRSELFDQLRNLVGEDKALDLYALTESEGFKDTVKAKQSDLNVQLDGARVFAKERVNPITNKPTGEIELELIESTDRGKGNARKALNEFLRRTDNLGKNVFLTVSPRDTQTTEKGLINFYKSVGFRLEPSGFEMTRRAKKAEPLVEDVLLYANETSEELTVEQSAQALDTMAALKVGSSEELFSVLQQAFVQDGMIVFDRKKLEDAGYNSYEITSILASTDLQQQIKENLFKVKNTNLTLDLEGLEVTTTDKIGLFGKQEVYVYNEPEGVGEVLNGEIADKKTDTLQTLRRTYPLERPEIDLEPFNTILKVTQRVAENNPQKVKKVVGALREEAFKYGVDLRGIENRIYPIAGLKNFTQELLNYINNPTDGFSEVYDKFFDIKSLPSPEQTENEVKLDTELSEYELFRDYNLVRKDGNTYTKISPENLEDLYNYFFRQQEQYKTKEEVQADVPQLEVEDYQTDSDVLEAMFMWKKFLGYDVKTKPNKKPSIVKLSDNPYKVATSNGVRLVSNDPLTQAKAELYEQEVETDEKDYQDSLREKIFNGEITPQKITTDYTIIEDGVLMTKNNTNQFLRTPQTNYELIFLDGNLSFYKEVVGAEKNLSDIDFTKYLNESVKPENYIVAKKYYTKQELEEINNKYFNCQ